MKAKRKKYAPGFRAKVALAALSEQETLAQLSKRFGVHVNMISRWKQELQANAERCFEKSGAAEEPEQDFETKTELFSRIGRLEVENNWLKKKYNQLFQ